MFRKFALAVGIAAIAAGVMPKLKADDIDKKVILTFSAAVEIPGAVLPAGTYVFKALRDNPSVFEVTKGDDNRPIGMFYTVRDYWRSVPGKVNVRLEERSDGSPQAVKSWAYPGDPYGFEFVYPASAGVK